MPPAKNKIMIRSKSRTEHVEQVTVLLFDFAAFLNISTAICCNYIRIKCIGLKCGFKRLQIDSVQYNVLMKTIAEAEIISLLTVIGEDLTMEDAVADKHEYYTEVINACMKDSLWKQVDDLPDIESGYVHLKYQEERAALRNIDLLAHRAIRQKEIRKLRSKTAVWQIAFEYGYESSSAVYNNTLSGFMNTHTSQVERLVVEKVFREHREQKQEQKRADAIMNEIFQIIL